tara:strand:+ start:199 stop:474 length:276 start_codon:yes stop_codon:yes gene_type:complete
MANVHNYKPTYTIAKRTNLRLVKVEGIEFNARILLRHKKFAPKKFEVYVEVEDADGYPILHLDKSFINLDDAKKRFDEVRKKFLRSATVMI